jgi:hypothetical protein
MVSAKRVPVVQHVDSQLGTATDYQPRSARKPGVPESGTVAEIWRWSETAPAAELL